MDSERVMIVQVSGAFTGSPHRFVNYWKPVVSGGAEYLPLPFTLTLPAHGTRVPIRVDGVPLLVVDALRAMATPPDVDVSIVTVDDPDTIEVSHRCALVDVKPMPGGMSGILLVAESSA